MQIVPFENVSLTLFCVVFFFLYFENGLLLTSILCLSYLDKCLAFCMC